MIKNVLIKRFKSIDEISIECKYLNIITGTNSSGKSTFLQSLLIMAQNGDSNTGINGKFINIGEFKDAKNFNVADKKIEIAMEFSDYETINLVLSEGGVILNDFYNDSINAFIAPNDINSMKYLSCNRIGAEDIYRKNFDNSKNIGYNGEFAIFCLDKYKSETLSKELISDSSSYTLLSQVNYWLDYILGATITTEDVVGTDYVKCFYTTNFGKQIRPKNIGAGLSYLISILVMCLLSGNNDVLIIENPEIHLHPQAQSKVCEFLYFIAKSGRQLFVETHSDHIFNGVRAGIATNKMSPDIIAVDFFAMNNNNCTENTTIEFGKRGRILNYKEGLFDQFDLDLNRMLGF